MKTSKRLLCAAALAAGLSAIGVGVSRAAGDLPGNGGHRMCRQHEGGPEGMDGMSFHGLKLTEQQQDQLFKLHHEMEPSLYQKMKALGQSREAMRKAAGFAGYNPAQVRQLAEAEAKQHAELEVMHIDMRHKMFALLTPEQQKQVLQQEQRHQHEEEHGPQGLPPQ